MPRALAARDADFVRSEITRLPAPRRIGLFARCLVFVIIERTIGTAHKERSCRQELKSATRRSGRVFYVRFGQGAVIRQLDHLVGGKPAAHPGHGPLTGVARQRRDK
jgi:hypothetical protein